MFGPQGGHKEFNRPRSVRPSQQAAMEANTRRPGPGAYHILSSLGRQVESNKPSPSSVSFGSSTRKQRKKCIWVMVLPPLKLPWVKEPVTSTVIPIYHTFFGRTHHLPILVEML